MARTRRDLCFIYLSLWARAFCHGHCSGPPRPHCGRLHQIDTTLCVLSNREYKTYLESVGPAAADVFRPGTENNKIVGH